MADLSENQPIRDLGNGLVLRRSTPADGQSLSDFYALIFANETPNEQAGQWAKELVTRPHPTFQADDFTLVEEKASGKIVSALNLISQTWTYAGIPFGVGRPEMVGTLPEYRRQGLVKMQFDEVHRWSAQRGELVQGITGIPFYYRQFGYEMCVDLGGERSGFELNVPKLAEGALEPFRLRLSSAADIPFLSRIYDQAGSRSLLYARRDEALWRLELNGRSQKSMMYLAWYIIERVSDGTAVGFVALPANAWKYTVPITQYELDEGISWLEVNPSVVRWLWQTSKTICESQGKTRMVFTFALGGSHPVYEIMRANLPDKWEPYAWYLRVPDLAAFIRRVAPVLEARLAASLLPGYSGELKIDFYRSGLSLIFAQGKLTDALNLPPGAIKDASASFPNLTILQLLFGHRDLEELKRAYADVLWAHDEAMLLLAALFPRKSSKIFPIG